MSIASLLRSSFVLLAFGAAAASSARAHYLWFERTPAGVVVVRFGEFENDLREKSPGRLDTITGLVAPPFAPKRTAEGFEFGADAARAAGLTAQFTAMEVKDWRRHGHGITKPNYYARFAPAWPVAAPVAPTLPLDLVPLPGGAVRVLFRGQPLKDATIVVHAPNGWSKEIEHLGDDARTVVPSPWPGLYVIEVVHAEAAPGDFEGKPYESIRHRATLAFPVASSR